MYTASRLQSALMHILSETDSRHTAWCRGPVRRSMLCIKSPHHFNFLFLRVQCYHATWDIRDIGNWFLAFNNASLSKILISWPFPDLMTHSQEYQISIHVQYIACLWYISLGPSLWFSCISWYQGQLNLRAKNVLYFLLIFAHDRNLSTWVTGKASKLVDNTHHACKMGGYVV